MSFRGSIPSLSAPLSTLRRAPHDAPRMTRGQCGSLRLHCIGLAPTIPCRSPGALRVDFSILPHYPGTVALAGSPPDGPARPLFPARPAAALQRGSNRQAIFFAAEDYARYRDWLAEAASRVGCAIHAYVLMTNHVHLLATAAGAASLPRMMQSLGRRYVRHVNAAYRRSGTLWEGRYRAAPIDSEAYFLACCRYIELNPV